MVSLKLSVLVAKIYIIGSLCALSYFYLLADGPIPKAFSIVIPIATALALMVFVNVTIGAHHEKTQAQVEHGFEHDFVSRPHEYDNIGGRPQGLNWL